MLKRTALISDNFKRGVLIALAIIFLFTSTASPLLASTLYFPHTNHQGSVIGYSDENGELVGNERYYVFGEEKHKEGDTTALERAYTGQVKDKTSDLYYYNARYYDPELSVFISPDPAGDNLNAFGYVSGNPVNFTDPTGLMLDAGEMGGGGGTWNGGGSPTDYPGGLTSPPDIPCAACHSGGGESRSRISPAVWNMTENIIYNAYLPPVNEFTAADRRNSQIWYTATLGVVAAIPTGFACLANPPACIATISTLIAKISPAMDKVDKAITIAYGFKCSMGDQGACPVVWEGVFGYQLEVNLQGFQKWYDEGIDLLRAGKHEEAYKFFDSNNGSGFGFGVSENGGLLLQGNTPYDTSLSLSGSFKSNFSLTNGDVGIPYVYSRAGVVDPRYFHDYALIRAEEYGHALQAFGGKPLAGYKNAEKDILEYFILQNIELSDFWARKQYLHSQPIFPN